MGKALIMSECDFSPANVGNIRKDLITIELTTWPGAVRAVASSPVYSQVTIQLADIGAIILPAGETSAILGISAAAEERVVSANISSSDDEHYIYTLTNNSINIPPKPDTDIRLISMSNEDHRGSKEGAIFTLLNYKTAKQVVGTPDELTDEFKEYFGPITWQLITSNGNEDVSLETNEGTRGIVDIYKNANAEIHVHVMGNLISNNGMDFFYAPAHFNISTFEDLLAIEYAVNNEKESELQLVKPQDAPNTTFANGSGFVGAIFRITNDIDCAGRHVEIGQYNTSLNKNHFFSGTIDGCFHTLKNIGGNTGIAGAAAQGGEVGSILIRHGKNAVVKNLRLEGSVSNIASRGYGGIIAMVEGNCYISAVYNAVSVYASDDITSSQVGMAGWQILGGKCDISESVFAGTNRAHFTVSGFQSCKGNNLQNCLMIGALECIVTTRNNSNIVSFDGEGANSGNQTVNCAAIGKYKQVGSDFKQMCVTYGKCQDVYECLLIESVKEVSDFSNTTATNVYSVNNFKNSTKVTSEQLRNGTLLNWDFNTEGFLPLPKGFFLTEPLVLSRIKYGYTENN